MLECLGFDGNGVFLCCDFLAVAPAAADSQAISAVMRASGDRRRYSSHVIAHGILHWYGATSQMPRGISVNCSSVRDWALRTGNALRKLAFGSVHTEIIETTSLSRRPHVICCPCSLDLGDKAERALSADRPIS